MKKTILALTIGALIASLGACGPTKQSSETKSTDNLQEKVTQTDSQGIDDFFASSFEADIKNSPLRQGYLGYKWDYDKWDTITEAQFDKQTAILKNRLTTLASFDKSQLSKSQKLSLKINRLSIERELANDEYRHHTYIMHQFRAFHTLVPSFLINIHRISDISDAEAYISRLDSVDTLFEQVIDQLRIREELGVFPPKWAYDQMIQASKNVITGMPFEESPDSSTIWNDFNNKLDKLELSSVEKKKLIVSARKAMLESVQPAYNSMIKELEKQRGLSPDGDGVWRLPDGDKWYANRLAWFTTTDLNADEVHQIGLNNVQRIHNAMREIMKKVEFEGSLAEFFEFMRTDKQFYYTNDPEGRDRYLVEATDLIEHMRSKIPEYFGLLPKADMIVKRVEAFREQSAGKAFYQSPSKDGSRPGTYYANLFDMNSMPTYQMEALAYHEGIPGHHMQRAIAQELEGIPEFQKYASFTAYTEGWGLYTEELAKDMGFYQDPYSDFGRLAMELWRACRLVVDTGIHAKQWSREDAINYLLENTPNPQNDVVKAIERYIAMPGQATAYMIGKLKIMELRAGAKQKLGEKFDIRGFHDEVLKDGPVPLNVLEDKINTWVASQ